MTQLDAVAAAFYAKLERTLFDDRRQILTERSVTHLGTVVNPESIELEVQPVLKIKAAGPESSVSYAPPSGFNVQPSLALFPVHLPPFSAWGAFGTAFSPLAWLDIENTCTSEPEIHPIWSSLRFNLPLLSELSGLDPGDKRLTQLSDRLIRDGLTRHSRRRLVGELERLAPQVDWSALAHPLMTMSWSALTSLRADEMNATCYSALFLVSVSLSETDCEILREIKTCLTDSESSLPLTMLLKGYVDSRKAMPKTSVSSCTLNTEQSIALDKANTHSISLVAGSPGSGKTQTLITIALDAVAKGRSVLLISGSNAGHDQLANQMLRTLEGQIPLVSTTGGGERSALAMALFEALKQDTPIDSLYADHRSLTDQFSSNGKRIKQLQKRVRQYLEFTSSSPLDNLGRAVKQILPSPLRSTVKPMDELQRELATLEAGQDRLNTMILYATYAIQTHEVRLNSQDKLNEVYLELIHQIGQISELSLSRTDWQTLLKVVPIWVIDPKAMARILPLKPGIFDLVIMDDADQLDLTCSLPAVYRGQALSLAGSKHEVLAEPKDPPSEDKTHDQNTQSHDTRGGHAVSIWRQALKTLHGSDNITQLNTCYRALGEVLSPTKGASEEYLAVTESFNSPSLDAVHWHRTAEGSWHDGQNEAEATALLLWLREFHVHADTEEAAFTVSIVSPFRGQLRCIERLAQNILPLQAYARHQIQFGGPDTIRGHEFDLVLCSMGVHEDTTLKETRLLDSSTLLNLLFSRARRQTHVFLSFQPERLPPNHRFRQVHDRCLLGTSVELNAKFIPFIRDLKDHGFEVSKGRIINGLQTSVSLRKHGQTLDVLVFGVPELAHHPEQLAHARRLTNAIFTLAWLDWTRDPEGVRTRLDSRLQSVTDAKLTRPDH